jgi:hypothetical protein
MEPRVAKTIRFALAVALALLAGTARAEGQAPAVEASEQPFESYSLQIVASDAIGYGLFALGVAFESDAGRDTVASETLFTIGGGTVLLGGPAIHLAHGEVGRAALSFGLRVALPIVGAAIGVRSASCGDANLCGLDEALAGLAIGSVIASVVDATLIAGPWRPPSSTAKAHSGWSLAPRVVATPELALVGVGGRF